MTTKESRRMQTPFDYLSNWSDGMHCWQAIQQLQSEPTVSAASARSLGLNRAARLIAHAREHSPLYAELYASIPPGAPLSDYPPVRRSTLMTHFDRWSCDRRINSQTVNRFLSSSDTIGERFLGDYLAWTSSGTSGEPGIYVQDRQALSIYQSLLAVRYQQNNQKPNLQNPWQLAFDTSRMAMIAALEGHFAGVVYWQWSAGINPWLRSRTRTFSILQPLPQLVEQLNSWQPRFLSSYPSMLSVLANEQASGRLTLSPNSLWCGGEHLDPCQRRQIEAAFGCSLIEDYGASEAMNMAFGCSHGRLHINTDWFILEPVDEHMQAVPAGRKSATTLVTNLANRVQPLIRYDIGDSITLHTDACDCGNPLPTLSVEGRNDDTLWLPADKNRQIPVLPLALNTIIEEHAGEFGFQIQQCEPRTLSIRTRGDCPASRCAAFNRIRKPLSRYLSSLGTLPITLHHDTRLPERDACSGKLNQVSSLSKLQAAETESG
ncbi:phenylacetate--CoA ligase family protein [Granulosicoccus sp. 3-233]|uniref:phenylacetate--CoA ligase family protein n=1 Tax=Granulosicoccus sp. 3-233 TaxID=3417969 RepID=UPI003D33C85D